MRRHLTLFCSLLGLTVLGLAAPPVRAQDTYRLLEKSAVGDAGQTDDDFNMDLTMTVTGAGQQIPPIPIRNSEHKKYLEQVLSVDASGHPDALRRTYSLARNYEKGPEGAKTATSSLQGKTVTIRRKGGQVVVTTESGALTAKDRESLLDALDNGKARFYPDHPVAVGDEWTIDPTFLGKAFAGATKITCNGKLMEIVPYEGHKCARFHLSLDIDTPLEGGMVSMEMKLEGDGYQALDIQRPLSIALTGPVSASGKGKANGLDLEYAGEGTAHMTFAVDWQRVAGKPVVKSNGP